MSYATSVVALAFIQMFVIQQLILMLLATPVLAAGAITDEKTRGTLQYLLTTDLHSWEIILGKMLGRISQVLFLAMTGLPLLCFLGVFAGVEPLTLIGMFVVTLLPLLAVGAASMLASVWCRQTRDAVLGLYAIGAVAFVLLLFFGGSFLAYFNPLYVLEPAWGQGTLIDLTEFLRRMLWSSLAWGSITVVCLGLAVWRLRPAYIRQLQGESSKKMDRWWRVRRAAVPENPIPWKERHVEGLAPIGIFRRIPTWVALLFIFCVTTTLAILILVAYLPAGVDPIKLIAENRVVELLNHFAAPGVATGIAWTFTLLGILAMLIASLVVGIRCSGAVCGERERQTWEPLLLSPLTSRQIIRGKLWGIIGASYLYLLAYAVPALLLALVGGPVPFFWTLIWLAVTWLAMYFVGAAGIWCSVRSKSSWRSLLGTVGIGYGGGALVSIVTSPVMAVLALIFLLFLWIVDSYLDTGFVSSATGGGMDFFFAAFQVAACLVLAGLFWGMAWFFISDAQKWVADRERTRHWKDEPLRLRPRRRTPERARHYR